jgi:hypothetical protein
MAVFRVEKTKNYTVMANFHLKDTSLTLRSKGLLSMILSLPEEWNYTTRGLAAICREGVDCIGAALKELERAGYIVRTQLRDKKGRITDTEYFIYERPQIPLDTAAPNAICPDTGNPDMVNPDAVKPRAGNPAQLNTNRLITKPGILKESNPYPSNHAPPRRVAGRTGTDGIGYDDAEKYREIVRENIEYKYIESKFNNERLDEIVDLIVEMLCSAKSTICISGDDYPASLVKEKFLRLNRMHIEYVFECLDKNTTYIRNIKKYLLATLFNAPSTIDSYYSALVNHDMYGDGSRGK